MPEHGGLRSLELIDGVGPAVSARFAALGIRSCEELLAEVEHGAVSGLASAVRGVSRDQLLESILPQARLLVAGAPLRAVGPLADAGVQSLSELAAMDTDDLRRVLGDVPREEALSLQLTAARQMMTGLVILSVRDAATGAPVTNAELVLPTPGLHRMSGASRHAADATGRIVSPRLRADEVHAATVFADGFRFASLALRVQGGGVAMRTVLLRAGNRQADADEARTSYPLVPVGPTAVTTNRIRPADVPVGQPFLVSELGQRTASLVGLQRRRLGVVLVMDVVSVPVDAIPPRVEPGDFVKLTDARVYRRVRSDQARRIRLRRFGGRDDVAPGTGG